MENRRHARKSRTGCFNCKSRKIKCSEAKPACDACQGRSLCCIYPSKAQIQNRRRKIPRRNDDVISQLTLVPPGATPGLFRAADFQHFHHFLMVAYPHLPFDSAGAWTCEIPQLAHQYEPLLHAVISLGASHFGLITSEVAETSDAVLHRGLALNGLRTMMAKGHYSNIELDVMLGICYSLTLQSGYMKDCLNDFVTMIRGCALITEQIMMRDVPSSVFCLNPENHVQTMLQALQNAPSLDSELLDEGVRSIRAFGYLLKQGSQRRFHHALLQTLLDLQISGLAGYLSFPKVYIVLFTMDEASFRGFMADNNHLTGILFAYFAALLVLMQPYLAHEIPERLSMYQIFGATHGWLDSIHHRLPVSMRGYIKWPFGITRAFQLNHRALGKDVWVDPLGVNLCE
ncbi:hypothetical protein AJ79_07978 [Helicocarpus griseus UAMH5409]|uniref:Zn(2)-C6 fungal-type domain-containing protein n=1 Tax=Helicocarpus griseus UAMH5409 TaxID=1447875 RepID=A0A2B7WWS5_9EURO|nr:hypothetical protein AJ79_07978 [Helicocarpus griseus UAMH5409]